LKTYTSCKKKGKLRDEAKINFTETVLEQDDIYIPVGCPKCFDTGYTGRTGIFEVLPINSKIAELIHGRVPASKIAETSKSDGMISLKDSSLRKLSLGISSVNEMNNI